MNRLNLISLGVLDLPKSREFYEALFGWLPMEPKSDEIVFYNMGGWLIGLYPREKLAEEVTVSPVGSGFSGITLAHNVREKEQVAPFLEKAGQLGGEIVKPAQDVFWGGHSGYFRELNGHFWEVAWNPIIPTLEDGTLDVPKI